MTKGKLLKWPATHLTTACASAVLSFNAEKKESTSTQQPHPFGDPNILNASPKSSPIGNGFKTSSKNPAHSRTLWAESICFWANLTNQCIGKRIHESLKEL